MDIVIILWIQRNFFLQNRLSIRLAIFLLLSAILRFLLLFESQRGLLLNFRRRRWLELCVLSHAFQVL